MNAPESHPGGIVPLMVTAVAGLLLLTINPVGDLDFGFYLASGRHFLAHGVPRNEFLAPLLADTPLSSLWVLSSLAITFAWETMGPNGLILLRVLGYGGGFALAALAARQRGATTLGWYLAMGLMAAFASDRFVERPGLFSVLLTGALMLVVARAPSAPRWERWLVLLPIFTLWPWLHAEWMIGLGALGLLLLDRRELPLWERLTLPAACGIAAVSVFAALHPSGIHPLLGPFRLFGSGISDGINEYSRELLLRPWVMVSLIAAAVMAVALARRGQWGEALLLAVLLALTWKAPRATLPLCLILVPTLALALGELWQRRRLGWIDGIVIVMAVITSMALMRAHRQPGLGIDEPINTRGIGAAFEAWPPGTGILLSSFGYSSLLLSNASVARQGVVMDGRQEAYPLPYWDEVYRPALRPAEREADWYRAKGIAFYYESWPTGEADSNGGNGTANRTAVEPSLLAEFRRLGWRLVAWDETGLLLLRPDLAADSPLPLLRFDPTRIDVMQGLGEADLIAAEEEFAQVIERLRAANAPLGRALTVRAAVLVALGRYGEARDLLAEAKRHGATRYSNWKKADELVRALAP